MHTFLALNARALLALNARALLALNACALRKRKIRFCVAMRMNSFAHTTLYSWFHLHTLIISYFCAGVLSEEILQEAEGAVKDGKIGFRQFILHGCCTYT